MMAMTLVKSLLIAWAATTVFVAVISVAAAIRIRRENRNRRQPFTAMTSDEIHLALERANHPSARAPRPLP